MNPELKKTLWATADKLRANMDAAEYKHLVLGLVFVKYVSDSFSEHRATLERRFADAADDFLLEDEGERKTALEDKDYYTQARVFWVPQEARWETLRNRAKQPDIGVIIDDALASIEAENPRLRGVLDKRFARAQLEPGKLGELVDLVSQIGFDAGDHARDVLGEVYEYFLGQFANAEGKKGGQFYTPASVVNVLVEMLQPTKGRVYDPCCGSGGMFVQSEKFVEAHGGRFGDISIYGQESNPTTWRLVAMNLAIRGMECDLGREPADTFHRNQHPDLRADYVIANPPFNISDWGGERLTEDRRWAYGIPPTGNANYAWLQHILYHLSPKGRAGVVLANGSLTSDQNTEGAIRRSMVDADVVECIVSLPSQLFFNTQVPACLWFLAKDKARSNPRRTRQVLFLDARKIGAMETRTRKVFLEADIAKLADTYRAWANGDGYEDVPGLCRSVAIEDITARGYALTPGTYVEAHETEAGSDHFGRTFNRYHQLLTEHSVRSVKLDQSIATALSEINPLLDWKGITFSSANVLEDVSRLLFRAWFVDFEPVRAKMEGRMPESCDTATAALFPDRLVDSEFGPIPEGWSAIPVYDTATFINGAAYKAFSPNAEQRGFPIVKIAELKAGITPQTAYSDAKMPDKYKLSTGDILFSWSGNPDTSIDSFIWSRGAAWLNQHIFKVVPPSPETRSLIYCMLKNFNPVFAELARNKQTTGLGHVTVADLKRLQTVKPPKEIVTRWNKFVDPLLEKALDADLQVRALEALRGEVLPRLMAEFMQASSTDSTANA